MLRTNLAVAFSLLVIVSPTTAEEKPAASPGVPPLFRKVFRVDQQAARLVLINRTIQFVASPVQLKTENRNSKTEISANTNYTPVYEERVADISLDSAQVSEAGGKKLSREDVLKRVSAGAIVVVSADGRPVDPVYLETLAKGTLVVVSPPYAVQSNMSHASGDNWSARPAAAQVLKSGAEPFKP